MNVLGFLLCKLTKHKRGKRVPAVTSTFSFPTVTYRCARCGAEWTRKVKPKAAAGA